MKQKTIMYNPIEYDTQDVSKVLTPINIQQYSRNLRNIEIDNNLDIIKIDDIENGIHRLLIKPREVTKLKAYYLILKLKQKGFIGFTRKYINGLLSDSEAKNPIVLQRINRLLRLFVKVRSNYYFNYDYLFSPIEEV